MPAHGDTFEETSDTALESHTPTGPYGATSWEATNAGAAIIVLAAIDEARDNNVSNGNRHRLYPALGADKMIVQADFTFQNPDPGDLIFAGVIGRVQDTPVGVQAGAYEFTYDFSVGANGSYMFEATELDEAWPGGTVTLTLVIDAPTKTGYANGLQKIQLTTDTSTGEQHAGIVLGNFTGGATERVFADNFIAQTLPPNKHDPAVYLQAAQRAAFF